MADFDEAAVLAWLATVPRLMAEQRAATVECMAEDEYDGAELIAATTKNLRRLLKGTEAEGAVPLLLAARDEHLAAAAAAAAAAAEQRAAAEAKPLAPPDEFVCAISQQLMRDPVTIDEGVPGTHSFIHSFIREIDLDCHRLHS
jgi:hypothetical protein